MRNPFQYGSIVGGESFCNREQEKADLRRAMESGDKLFVYSERRLGKTSLVRAVLEQLPRSYAAAYVDLWPTDGEAAAEPEGVKPFSGAFVRRYRLRSSSNAQRAAEALTKRDVVDRDNGTFLFLDRFFRLWVQRLQR